jgi:hypothetical protein
MHSLGGHIGTDAQESVTTVYDLFDESRGRCGLLASAGVSRDESIEPSVAVRTRSQGRYQPSRSTASGARNTRATAFAHLLDA